MNKFAPIVLFVYNRPDHALKTLESLAANEEATQSILYIFCDGPKATATEETKKRIRETIAIARSKKWCLEVIIRESPVNKGLAKSVTDGVTEVVNRFGRVIVLEDDLETSPYFLKYMNEALDLYEKDEKVISIHGYVYPVKQELPETFFLKGADCWGWATWKRGWDLFETDGIKLMNELKERNLAYEFDFNGTYPFTRMLKKQIEGKNDSWAIRWNASAFLKEKLTLYPGHSLIQNIGTEGSGTHVGHTENYHTVLSMKPVTVKKINTEANLNAFRIFTSYFRSIQPGFIKRVLKKLSEKLS